MFKASNLSVLAYANNFTLWHYLIDGNTVDAGAPGYFDKASDMLRVGDRIILQANDAVRDITVTKTSDGSVGVWLPGVFGVGFNSSIAEEDKARLQSAALTGNAQPEPASVSDAAPATSSPTTDGVASVEGPATEQAEANVAPAAEVQTAA